MHPDSLRILRGVINQVLLSCRERIPDDGESVAPFILVIFCNQINDLNSTRQQDIPVPMPVRGPHACSSWSNLIRNPDTQQFGTDMHPLPGQIT